MKTKVCTACKQTKPNKDFHRNASFKDGFAYECKACKSERDKANYLNLDYRLSMLIRNVKRSCDKNNLPFDIDLEYLKSIVTKECPVFKIKLGWDVSGKGMTDESPSLDKVIPELGYVKGNVVFISNLANRIKQNVTEKELYAVADWLHDKRKEVLNAIKKQSAPVPVEHLGESQGDTASGSIHGTGFGQDCDGAHHHRGEPEREDACDSTQEGCRICMGSGVRQVEALELYANSQDYGLTKPETERLAKLFGCVCYQH